MSERQETVDDIVCLMRESCPKKFCSSKSCSIEIKQPMREFASRIESAWRRAKYWDRCFNPIIGCHKLSPACDNCYAEAFVKRFNMTGCACKGFEPTRKSNGKKMPQRGVVFCGNITDLFGSWVTPEEHDDWFKQMNRATVGSNFRNEAAYLWLTKRPGNMARAICESYEWIGKGAYFGITAENQEWYDRRIERLFEETVGLGLNYWISAEPLLGPIDLHLDDDEMCVVSWVVVGCESGPKRRPCKIEWVESIVDQCMRDIVPVFVKQLDIGGKCVTDIAKFPRHLQIRQVPWEIAQ